MLFLSLLSLLVPLLIAFVLISSVWPEKSGLGATALKLSLAVGLGFGLFSCVFFAQLLAFGPSRTGFISAQAALFTGLLAAFYYKKRARAGSPAPEAAEDVTPGSRLRLMLAVAFFVALASATLTFIFISLKRPHGEWDAWAVFNMKARFLFRAGENWRDVFSEPMYWSGTDYPLLIPTTIASLWTMLGKEALAVYAMVAMLFTLATVGVATYTIAALRGKTQAYLAGLILLSTPYFITHGADQYSDIPIGFFFLSTIALLTLYEKYSENGSGLLALAGMMAGLAAWTKNEGILFVLLVFAARFITVVPKAGLKTYLRQMLLFAAGALPALALVFCLKMTLAQPNGLLAPPGEHSLIAKLLTFSRYQTILDFFVRHGLAFGNWPISIVTLLAFHLLLVGAKVEARLKASLISSALIIGLMLAGYFMIYVISPRDLAWHMLTSIDRLFSQLWPSFVFIFFLIARTPEQALAKQDTVSLAEESLSKDKPLPDSSFAQPAATRHNLV